MTNLILILGIAAILISGTIVPDQIAFADDDDHEKECKEDLEDFIKKINKLIDKNKLSEGQGQSLISSAEELIENDCGTVEEIELIISEVKALVESNDLKKNDSRKLIDELEDVKKEIEKAIKKANENTLEFKCAKQLEKKHLNLYGLLCAAIFALQSKIDAIPAGPQGETGPQGPPGPSGGGGGGGGSGFPDTVPFTRYMFFEEFYWQDDSGQPLEDKYDELGGSGSIKPASDIRRAGGVIEIQSAPIAGRGEGLGLANKATPTGSWTDPTKNTESRIRAGLLTPLTDRIDFIGFMDATPTASGAITVESAEANFANGAYFRSLDGGNWQAVTMNTSTKTETDTGVTPVAGEFQNFEILFTSDQVEFKINGSTVATHMTHVPTVLIFLQNYVASTIVANHSQLLDSWYIIGDR